MIPNVDPWLTREPDGDEPDARDECPSEYEEPCGAISDALALDALGSLLVRSKRCLMINCKGA